MSPLLLGVAHTGLFLPASGRVGVPQEGSGMRHRELFPLHVFFGLIAAMCHVSYENDLGDNSRQL